MKSLAQDVTRFGRVAVVLGAVALVGGGAACAAEVAPREAATTQRLETCGHAHFRSPVQVVIDAATQHGELSVAQEQRLAGIGAELEEEQGSFRALRERLRTSAAQVVRAGSARSEAFDEGVAEALAAVEARSQQGADALEEIHAVLEDDQRAAVAAALHVHIDERFGPRPERQHRRDGFKRFASQLMLSGVQLDQLRVIKKELLGEARELRPSAEELHALVDAFEGDDFGAALDDFRGKKSRILRARVARASERTETVLSIFTPDQRELLADLILEGPSKVLLGETEPAP